MSNNIKFAELCDLHGVELDYRTLYASLDTLCDEIHTYHPRLGYNAEAECADLRDRLIQLTALNNTIRGL